MPQPIDVYLLAGQSNITGHGSADQVPDALVAAHPTALLYHAPLDGPDDERSLRPASRTWAPLAPGFGRMPRGFGPELSLGHDLAEASPSPIAIIKCEQPGTSLFADWRPEELDDTTTLATRCLDDAALAIEQLFEDGFDPRFAGFVWYQGESDTDDANHEPDRYAAQLRALLERIDDELAEGRGCDKVFVRVNPADPQAKHLGVIRQQIEALANADARAAWIDVDDLALIDAWHVDGPGLIAVGKRVAAALAELRPSAAKFEPEPSQPAVLETVPASEVDSPLDASLDSSVSPASAVKPPSVEAASEVVAEEAPPVAAVPASKLPGRSASGKPRIIAMMNQKGGVGKTTTTVNVGAALANLGHSVLAIDLDPQAHLSLSLGIEPDGLDKSLYDLFTNDETTAMEIVRHVPPDSRNLAVLPAETNLAGIESELADLVASGLAQTILRNKCNDLAGEFDYVLLDCPPSLGLLTINALTMADEIIVPMQAHFLALQGMTKLFETIGMVRKGINPNLTVSGVVLCMHEANTILANDVIGEIENFFEAARNTDQPWANAQVYQPPVRRNIKLAEAPSFGQSVIAYAPESNGAKDYLAVAKSIAGM
ncbi:MAG: AAA family ATPase [Algisphaera sp.]